MIRSSLLIVLLLAFVNGITQNLITNGSFENFTSPCPNNSPNGALYKVASWRPGNPIPGIGVPDIDLFCGNVNYFGCTPGPVPNTGSHGIAYLGFHTRIFTSSYNESIYQTLATSLTPGATYIISFDLMTCQSGIFTSGQSDFCVYTNIDTVIPACPKYGSTVNNVGCIPFNSISDTIWKSHSFQFTAPASSNNIVFSGDACDSSDIYYYLDNIVLIADTSTPIDTTTSVTENFFKREYKIYPNPFSRELNITHDSDLKLEFSLFDMMSKLVYQVNFIHQTRITTDKFESGVYFYKIVDEKGKIEQGRILKQ